MAMTSFDISRCDFSVMASASFDFPKPIQA
jgi:hypothetical protein